MKVVSTITDPMGELNQLNNNVLHVFDVFDHTILTELTAQSTPKYIVSDHWTSVEFSNFKNIYCAPLWLANQVELLKPDLFPTINNQYGFNFMINKKQVNRYLCIKLIELFKLSGFNYTWSGIGKQFDMSNIIKELNVLGVASPLNQKQLSFLLAPITLPENFLKKPDQNIIDKNSRVRYQGNVWTWNNIFKNFFSSTAISLITESVGHELGAVFTEKTAFPTLGLNFPIWVGGFNQASEWQRLGFDIFDDIIDHSYENKSTLVERCYYAIFNNIELLQNKKLAHKLRQKHMDRLISNRNLMLNGRLVDVCKQIISTWPTDLQNSCPKIYNHFPQIKHFF